MEAVEAMTKDAKDELNEYCKKIADEYKPNVSDDPMENECMECTMSEKLHEIHPEWTCGKFKDGRKKG
jgi:hypothetical protein